MSVSLLVIKYNIVLKQASVYPLLHRLVMLSSCPPKYCVLSGADT